MRISKRLLAALLLLFPLAAAAEVRVVSGPTPIPEGNAHAGGDLTVINEHLAFALAVESPVPYGVPRGAIIDVARSATASSAATAWCSPTSFPTTGLRGPTPTSTSTCW